MNLEDLEGKVLRYLDQVRNPLVNIDVLVSHLRGDEGFSELTKRDLTDFLSRHDLFKILDTTNFDGDSNAAQALAEVGFSSGPHVLLKTRVPVADQLAGLMRDQLDSLDAALSTALNNALDQGDGAAAGRIQKTLARVQGLRGKIDTFDGDLERD